MAWLVIRLVLIGILEQASFNQLANKEAKTEDVWLEGEASYLMVARKLYLAQQN